MELPVPLMLLLLATISPISGYAIIEPFQPEQTPTLAPRQQTPTPIPNLAAASISASLSASFATQLALQTNSVQSLLLSISGLERNLAETRRGLSLAQEQVVSAIAATRVAGSVPSPTPDSERETALADDADCQTALPRPQALCSGTARTISIVGFVFGGIGLIALGFLTIVFCRWRQRGRGQQQQEQFGHGAKRSIGDAATISTVASTWREKNEMGGIGGSFFSRRERNDEAGEVTEMRLAATRQNGPPISQRKRFNGEPGHLSISTPLPGSGPIRSDEERNPVTRPPLTRHLSSGGQDGSGETLTFVLSPNVDVGNRLSTASQDYLIAPNGPRRNRESGDSEVIPAGTVRMRGSDSERTIQSPSPMPDLSNQTAAGGQNGRDTLSQAYDIFMASVVQAGNGRTSVNPRPAPAPPILSPDSTRTRERMI